MYRPTLPALLYFALYSNGFVLFSCQHATCSMARWSVLGGMQCRLWSMNTLLHHLHVWGGKAWAYTSMFMFICVGKRRSRHKCLPHTPQKHYIRLKELISLLLDCSGQWRIALSRSRLIVVSEFSSHSQLLYGPCMSSLTAAVFTSRLDWYG